MKSLNFNTDSWHFKLAELAGMNKYRDSNICEYTRNVLGGALLMALTGVIIAIGGFILAHMIFAVGFSIAYGFVIFTDLAFIGWTTLIFGAIFCLIVIISDMVEKRRYKRLNDTQAPQGFIAHAYDSWKNKFCAKVEFNLTEEEKARY
jgi:hypothetical protein